MIPYFQTFLFTVVTETIFSDSWRTPLIQSLVKVRISSRKSKQTLLEKNLHTILFLNSRFRNSLTKIAMERSVPLKLPRVLHLLTSHSKIETYFLPRLMGLHVIVRRLMTLELLNKPAT